MEVSHTDCSYGIYIAPYMLNIVPVELTQGTEGKQRAEGIKVIKGGKTAIIRMQNLG